MKTSAALAFILGCAPAALAQTPVLSCELFDTLIAVAPGGFRDQRGEEIRPGLFASQFTLAGYSCVVFDAGDAGFVCRSPVLPEAIAKGLYASVGAQISSCLTGWKRLPLVPAEGDLVVVDGARFFGPETGEDLAVGFTLFRSKEKQARDHIVSFGVLLIRSIPSA